jgi:hypothetical protein
MDRLEDITVEANVVGIARGALVSVIAVKSSIPQDKRDVDGTSIRFI